MSADTQRPEPNDASGKSPMPRHSSRTAPPAQHARFRSRLAVPALLTVAGSLLPLANGCARPASVLPHQLACEFRDNPQGIAASKPRLSWRLRSMDDNARGNRLRAFRVVVASTPHALARGAPLLWDSRIIQQSASEPLVANGPLPNSIEYAGMPLTSRSRAWWRVKGWDQHGRDTGWSEPASFSVGLLNPSDWQAVWIGLDSTPPAPLTASLRNELLQLPWIRMPGAPQRQQRVAWFRTEFELPPTAITQAWIAGTADMMADVTINGATVGQLSRWEPVRAIDVASALAGKRNAIGIRVENHDGLNPAVTGMLAVRFADGSEQRVTFDKSWRLCANTQEGWDRAGFGNTGWQPVEVADMQPWRASRNTEHYMPPAPFLRKTFTPAAGKSIQRATLYATALGVYECRLNGTRVGNAEFAPGWTEYARRVEHQTHDVTHLVRSGANCLGAVLGDGWYAGLLGYTGQRRFYGGPARFMGQLEIDYTDGTRDTIGTDASWRAAFGPIRYTDNYMGSDYDSRLEMKGWDTARFDDRAWQPAEVGLARNVNRREADVTSKVRAAFNSPGAVMVVGPKALGDPAYGKLKTLRVEYASDGRQREISLAEGESLSFPRPGESAPTVITRAVFSEIPALPVPPPVIEPQRGDNVQRVEAIRAISVTEPRPGRYVFDLGQNMVGWARLKVRGHSGQRLVVRHAEMLNPDGTLYTSNLRGATATDFFMLKGGTQTLEPPFTFHGFRYVEVTGLARRPRPSMVTGIVAHTSMRKTGTFTCSSELINKLVRNIEWGQRGNYFEVPTDCPQRDERLGWTGDAQFFVNTAAYNFDIASFMSRWLNTLIQDSQLSDGTFTHVAPRVNEGGGSTAWGDAAIFCTHAMYQTYGDRRVITDNYDAMCRYMAWLDGKTTNGIAKVGGYGDWLNLQDPTSQDLIDTAYRAELCRLMAVMAEAIGKSNDAARFDQAHVAAVTAFRARFVRMDGSLMDSGQTGYALAFSMRLIPDDMTRKCAAQFAASLKKRNWRLATGFIGTPRLLPALAAAGLHADAGRLLMNEDYPSWLYQVKLGATTMWERWDGWTPQKGFADVQMNSFNHYAFGSVGDYLYRFIAGISPLSPGYQRILIAPNPIEQLDHANATYDSPAGMIKSAWQRTHTGMAYDITIPPSTVAEIRLPVTRNELPTTVIREGGRSLELAAGLVVLPSDAQAQPCSVRMRAMPGRYQFVVDNDAATLTAPHAGQLPAIARQPMSVRNQRHK